MAIAKQKQNPTNRAQAILHFTSFLFYFFLSTKDGSQFSRESRRDFGVGNWELGIVDGVDDDGQMSRTNNADFMKRNEKLRARVIS